MKTTTFSTGISPETTACLIEAIANDKASRIKALSRTAVIMNVCPEWMRSDEVTAYFGIPPNQLRQMAIDGKIIAKKLDPLLTQSAVIFKVADIRKAIDKLSPYDEWIRNRPDLKTPTKGK